MRTKLFAFAAIVIALSSALKAAPESPLMLRVLFLDESKSAYFLKQDGETVFLSGSPYQISRPIAVTRGQAIEILKAESGRKNSKKKKILSVPAPDDGDSALLVVTPEGGESNRYKYELLQGKEANRPSQSLEVYNLGITDTAVVIGSEKAQIPSGNSSLLNLNPDSKNRVVAKVGEKTNAGWRMIYDGIISLRPNERMTAVIVYSPTGMRYTYTDQEIIEYGEPDPGHFWLTYTERM